jgi:DNA-directed RNA polymerase subunit alpha
MKDIALPKKVEFLKGEKPEQGTIIVEPCFPGYGITLGNSLRRVLLSSLSGAAVVGVKIKGADHEFMSLPHVQEDVLDIVLNLKKLRLKIFSEDENEIKLDLEVRGAKEVKASDIAKNSQVEIVNPDLGIANITDMAGNLKMEIFVAKGRGFRAIENIEGNEHGHEIGYITMDAIFSPVIAAGIRVENVRVGKMTNWDKLIIDVTTDGTITPEEAFKKSVGILIDQFKALSGEAANELAEETAKVEEEKIETEPTEKVDTEKVEEAEDATGEKKRRGRPKKI